jgi:hypothetical protein
MHCFNFSQHNKPADTVHAGSKTLVFEMDAHIAMNCLTLFIAGMDTYKLSHILPTHTAIQLTEEH